MNIFITGGSGFVGSALVNKLVSDEHNVTYTGNQTEQKVKNGICLEPGLYGIDFDRLKSIDIMFHQAANNNTLCQDEQEMMFANFYCAKETFIKAFDKGCKQFVFASSTAVYGDSPAPYYEDSTPLKPLNAYAKSKEKFEKWAMEWGNKKNINIIGLRYCNIYGPGEDHKGSRASMIYQMAKRISQKKAAKLFKYGQQLRDWIYIDDVISANISAMNYKGCDIFNIGSGEAISFIGINNLLNQYFGGDHINPEWIDNPNKESYQVFTKCDIKKATKLPWWPKYTIKEGITSFLNVSYDLH